MSERDSICASAEKPVEYRDIEGFPGYRVGDDGSVWSCRKIYGRRAILTDVWKRLKPARQSRGYLLVSLRVCVDGKMTRTTRFVHRLVLASFVGPAPDGCEACHNDGNRYNNILSNLRWDTRVNNIAENRQHVPGRVKASDDTIRYIRSMRGKVSQRTLAKQLGMSHANIGSIARGDTWKQVS